MLPRPWKRSRRAARSISTRRAALVSLRLPPLSGPWLRSEAHSTRRRSFHRIAGARPGHRDRDARRGPPLSLRVPPWLASRGGSESGDASRQPSRRCRPWGWLTRNPCIQPRPQILLQRQSDGLADIGRRPARTAWALELTTPSRSRPCQGLTQDGGGPPRSKQVSNADDAAHERERGERCPQSEPLLDEQKGFEEEAQSPRHD